MDRHLIDYLPPALKTISEFQAINSANEQEISLVWGAVAAVLSNQFLESADENGVSAWERELDISPKDTDSLESRKARIKAAWNLEKPYTLSWLKKWLSELCGPIGHEETVSGYTLEVQLDYNALPDAESLAAEILKMLSSVIPANMQVLLTAFHQSYGVLSAYGGYTEIISVVDISPK